MATEPVARSTSASAVPTPLPKVSFLFVTLAGIFITCLLSANIIAVKLIAPFGLLVPAGTVVFPLAYLFGDVLTEVYGYAATRLVIWLGFFCNVILVAAIWVAGIIPAAPIWNEQSAYAAKCPAQVAPGLKSISSIQRQPRQELTCPHLVTN